MAARFKPALRPLLDTCVPPHWSYRLIWERLPNASCSWHISSRARLSHASVIDTPPLTMVNASKSPVPGPSDNNAPSCEINPPRTIILCFDGTGNQFSESNTNIVKLFSVLRKNIPKSQVCYYQAGIGTYIKPGVVSPIFRSLAKILDMGFAWYISEHIIEGYTFLMQNYHEGDKICIFGFSRGAYTARALAGMLHKVGLLSKDNVEQIPFAYNLYKKHDRKADKLAERFKNAFARRVVIDFLGVWDTVSSVGYLYSPTLPFVGSNDMVKVFRHAVSLDEHRAMFRPNLYHHSPDHSDPGTINAVQQTPSVLNRVWGGFKRVCNALNPFGVKVLKRRPDTPRTQTAGSQKAQFKTDDCEVWFPGCHSDVGGGNTEDIDDTTGKLNPALANISLRWMLREVVANQAKCPVYFDKATLDLWNIPTEDIQVQPLVADGLPDAHYFREEDARVRKKDELKRRRLWYIIEILPTSYEWQDEQGQWLKQWSWHLAAGRVPPPRAKFHRSVRWRLEHLRFKTNAKFDTHRLYNGDNIVD